MSGNQESWLVMIAVIFTAISLIAFLTGGDAPDGDA